MYTPTNSHDPKTDHRSLFILIAIVVAAITGLVVLLMGVNPREVIPADPHKYAEIDGCAIYRFSDEHGVNYFANCPSGNSAVTMANGKHIPSFKESDLPL